WTLAVLGALFWSRQRRDGRRAGWRGGGSAPPPRPPPHPGGGGKDSQPTPGSPPPGLGGGPGGGGRESTPPPPRWRAAGVLVAGWCLAGTLAYAYALAIPWRTTLNPDGFCCALLTCFNAEPLVSATGTAAWLLALLVLARRDWTLAALGLIWTAAF